MCTQDGVILWDMVGELETLELLFHLHARDDIAWDVLEVAMAKNELACHQLLSQLSFAP